ncbi:MAG: dTMP kinase [Candidatus Gastranaerophilales bacterium]|nr:dTMP kinase [Candidatus Gastranaerophilales bacterium]
MSKKGLFITFEGADGSGKTTQVNKVKEYLENKGYKCLLTREPGGSELGAEIRKILLHYDGYVDSLCELLLYMADRAQHVKTVIIPAIERGEIVLCDRHTDSSVAYQGYGRGLDIERIVKLNEIATDGLVPDLTILYDVETDTAMTRVGETKDRLEQEGYAFHKKLRLGYLELAKRFAQRFEIIDANKNIDEVFEQTKKIINKKLEQ